jgi:hypothetical protein
MFDLAAAQAAEAPDQTGHGELLRMGQWERLQIGMFNPMPEDQGWDRKYYQSLRHTGTWFGPFLRNKSGQFQWTSYGFEDMDDSKGWTAYRPIMEAAGVPWKDMSDAKGMMAYQFMRTMKGSSKGLVRDAEYKPWAPTPAKYTLTADKKNQYTLQDSPDVITFDEKTIHWNTNDGNVKLTGQLATPGVQLMWPWREPDGRTESMLYTAQWYKVEGTYYGEPVTGFIPIEQIWGDKNYVNTWWVKHREYYLILFATTYDDGTTESGVIQCERLTGRGAVIANSSGKAVLSTTELNLQPTKNAAGKVTHVVYKFRDAPDWEFIADSDSAGIFYEFGTVKRVGEKRKIVRSAALQANALGGNKCQTRPFSQY